MRLRIVSDGTPDGTRVVDERGHPLHGVASVVWQMERDRTVTATITIREVEADLVVDESPKTAVVTCPICEHQLELPTKDIGRRADVEGKDVRWKCGKCGKYSYAEDWFDTSGMN